MSSYACSSLCDCSVFRSVAAIHTLYIHVRYWEKTAVKKLGLCLGWYGQLIRDLHSRSSIFQQPACRRIATAAKPVAASRLWCAVPVKQRNTFFLTFFFKTFYKFNWVTGSPPKFDTFLASWYPTYMQSFIISHSSCAEQYSDMCTDTHTHSLTHK